MKRAVLTFLLLMALLGIGTVLVVEKFSHERILPRSVKSLPINEFVSVYDRTGRVIKRWWNDLTGYASARPTPMPVENNIEDKGLTGQKIIKWQDKNGTWHYEFESLQPTR